MTVEEALTFFAEDATLVRPLTLLQQIGLGYLRLDQPATELSGAEAQRIKLATELQRAQRGETLYVLDELTTGLHPSDVDKLLIQLTGLVDAGNTVVVVEHEMRIVAACDRVIDIGPGAGAESGTVVCAAPEHVAKSASSRTSGFLKRELTSTRESPHALRGAIRRTPAALDARRFPAVRPIQQERACRLAAADSRRPEPFPGGSTPFTGWHGMRTPRPSSDIELCAAGAAPPSLHPSLVKT